MLIGKYPVAVIGAGPVGMAAAAHLAVRNIPFLLFEAGNSVGASMLDFGHVRFFSPWRYNIDKAAEKLLSEVGWIRPDAESLPTGREVVYDYLLPLMFHPRIEPFVHLGAKVTSIARKGLDKVRTANRENVPFIIRVVENGNSKSYEASAVIDASGTWFNPNPVGAGGLPAAGESENASRIAYRIPDIPGVDKQRYAGKNVMVIGGGHSAINSLLELAALKQDYPATMLHWVLLAEDLSVVYGGKEDDALEARGALGVRIEKLVNAGLVEVHSPYYIHEILERNGSVVVSGYKRGKHHEVSGIDEIIANTGARPEMSMLREVRVQFDPSLESVPELAELIDPNVHSCGTVRAHGELELRQPEPNFYVAGVKSYGRAPTFLMATGYEQVRSIVAYLDGDLEGARRVELDLPETGVCSVGGNAGTSCCGTKSSADTVNVVTLKKKSNTKVMEKNAIVIDEPVVTSGCCGGAPATNEDACCKLDEDKKAEGESGCGCSSSATAAPRASSCC